MKKIDPEEIQINTPLRPSPIRPLTPKKLEEARKSFETMNSISVYESQKKKVEKIVGEKKLKHLKRRGGYP